jgi:restriction endonuclease S subunit
MVKKLKKIDLMTIGVYPPAKDVQKALNKIIETINELVDENIEREKEIDSLRESFIYHRNG